jgi:Tol biopolymer transport system component
MIGKKLGHYRITAQIGAGGMGEVFRAQDLTLGRDVALKLLPAEFADDPERLARFRREAALLAALNHPNIATLHGLETDEGVHFLVMEVVEGEDLAARLSRGPLAVAEALHVARQVAASLVAAHQKGIIHRDLKPANIRLTPEGTVKVLDFGLAKGFDEEPRTGDLSQSPTMMTAAQTRAGFVMGTAAYMAPEQARGKPLDPRVDVWAFGCVLYECLTGKQAFAGETVTDILAKILEREPDWEILPAETPAALRMLLQHCLAKDPRKRWRDMGDVAVLLDETQVLSSPIAAAPALARRRSRALPMLAAAALVVAVLAFVLGRRNTTPEATRTAAPSLQFTQLTVQSGPEGDPCLSPDGNYLVYAAYEGEERDIYLQRIGGFNPINLTPNTPEDDDSAPAYSPDGRRIAFRSSRDGGGIFVMGSTGESVRRLSDVGFDPAWSPDGRFLVADSEGPSDPLDRGTRSSLWVIDVENGEKRLLTEGDAVQPDWSPGGERIAYWSVEDTTGGRRDLWTIRADGSEAVPITRDAAVDWKPVWSPDGRFLYFASDRAGSMNLWRVPIDEASGQVLGEPQPLGIPTAMTGKFDVSRDGRHLAYESLQRSLHLGRIDFQGSPRQAQPMKLITQSSLLSVDPSVSPDGEWVVFRSLGTREDLYLIRTDGTQIRKLTDDAYRDRGPAWAPDGSFIVFYSDRSGRYEYWRIRPDGSGLEQVTRTKGRALWYPIVSPEGKRLLGSNELGTYVMDLKALPVATDEAFHLPPIEEGLLFSGYAWSPDGTQLAGRAGRPNGSTMPGLYVYRFESNDYRLLNGDLTPGGMVWVDEGRHLLTWDGGKLFEVEARSGAARVLLEGIDFMPRTISAPRDGSALFFTTGSFQSDIWLTTMQ